MTDIDWPRIAEVKAALDAVEKLHEERRQIIRQMSAAGMSTRQIAPVWGVSQPRIVQMLRH
jgi:DNA-directed RNA polymerase specialized sigma subunit